MYSKIDLHTHTTASDGTLSPRELVAVAIARGLKLLAITDHDSTEGLGEACFAARGSGLEIWAGVEISTDVPGAEVHVLGHLVDHQNAAFQAILKTLRDSRVERARRMVAKLATLGLTIEWSRVQEIARDGAIGRPHVAQALLEQGYVADLADAFNRYIGRNGPAYVERYRLTPEEAVGLVVKAGGVASLAHPVIVNAAGRNAELDLEALLPRLVPAGLAGMEVYYPGYDAALTARLSKLADRWGLTGTGGSDYHGRGTLTTNPGDVRVPGKVIDLLRERHRQQTSTKPPQGEQLKKSA